MVPSPFLDTIVKPEADGGLSITVYRKPHIQTSIYSGTVTITSQPNLVSSKLFPTGLPPCAVILSCFKRKGAPQESSHQMQLPQMGFGQGGEKA